MAKDEALTEKMKLFQKVIYIRSRFNALFIMCDTADGSHPKITAISLYRYPFQK